MKRLLICVWLISVLFFCFRGNVRPTFVKTLIRHSVIILPLNALLINFFFKYGWKRFYLKWYGFEHPSVLASCPKAVTILKKVQCIKAAMFAELPPKGKLNPHRDPFAGSLRYRLGLFAPNSEKCYIDVDGKRY